MVGRGKKDAYQLPGVTGCHSGSQSFAKNKTRISILLRVDNTTAVTYIRKSPGRYNLARFSQVDKESVDVVPGEKYPHHSITPPRVTEHNCQCRVQTLTTGN